MRHHKISLLVLLSLLAGLALTAVVKAQEGVTVRPGQVTVVGTRGTVTTRQILLRSDKPLSGVRFIPEDLKRADEVTVLSASAIQPELAGTEVGASGVLTIPVRFVLRGVPSGEFNGDFLLI